jgi:osmotically inducible protein OsmC
MPTRHASARWEGGFKSGKGTYKGETGFAGAYSAGSRFENAPGSNPEELLAAAEAACFSMALSVGLEKNSTPPKWIEAKAGCTVERVNDAFKITTMELTVRASVPGLDDATFQKIAAATKDACPVSTALKGNVVIRLSAALEG